MYTIIKAAGPTLKISISQTSQPGVNVGQR